MHYRTRLKIVYLLTYTRIARDVITVQRRLEVENYLPTDIRMKCTRLNDSSRIAREYLLEFYWESTLKNQPSPAEGVRLHTGT